MNKTLGVMWSCIKAFGVMISAMWLIVQGRWFVFRNASDLSIIILYHSLQYEEYVDDLSVTDKDMQPYYENFNNQLTDEYKRRKNIRTKKCEYRRKTRLWV